MNLNEAIRAAAAGKKVTTGGPTPTTGGVTPTTGGPTPDTVTMTAAKEAHHKKVEAQLYRIDNAETEAPEGETLDEAQFILLKKGGTTKRIRNDPDEIARAKAQGWVVVGTQTEEVVDEAILGGAKYKGKKNPNTRSDSVTLAQDMTILKSKKPVKEEQESVNEISKDKLHAYVVKAVVSRAKAHKDAAVAQDKKNKVHRPVFDKDYESEDNFKERKERLAKRRKGHEADQNKADKVADKRTAGLYKAGRSLAKEELKPIDELSTKTLDRYIDAAAADSGEKLSHGKGEEYDKRTKGIDKAKDKKVKKLTKEDLMDMSVEDAKALLEDAMKRGRPSKDSSDGKEHIIVGLRKAISLKGHDVHFGDGSKHSISPDHAANLLQKHDAFQKPSEKMAFAQRIAASHDSLKKAVSSVPKSEKPKEDNSTETKKPTKAITVKIDK